MPAVYMAGTFLAEGGHCRLTDGVVCIWNSGLRKEGLVQLPRSLQRLGFFLLCPSFAPRCMSVNYTSRFFPTLTQSQESHG
jgi:hypothetical protein